MRKKVKLADLDNEKWKVKDSDRSTVSRSKSIVVINKAMQAIAEQAERQTKILEALAKATDQMVITINKPAPVVSNQPPPNIEVIVPQGKEVKKKFRVTPVRNEHGIMEYADIEQL